MQVIKDINTKRTKIGLYANFISQNKHALLLQQSSDFWRHFTLIISVWD